MIPAEPAPPATGDCATSSALGSPVEGSQLSARTALLERAYDEYYHLLEQGQQPEVASFCARFPAVQSQLMRLFDAEACLADHFDRQRAASSADESVLWPRDGEQRGDWTIVREMARGSFARVYLATEAATGNRLVVLKFCTWGDAEARTLGRLAHPNVVPILSARREEATGFTIVCMPYLGGVTLKDLLDSFAPRPRRAAVLLDRLRERGSPEDAPLAPADPRLQRGSFTDGTVYLAISLAETLAFLHARGVHHSDLKPSNILLDPSGKPLLLDFNLSRGPLENVPLGGTPLYMAPEQLAAFLGEDGSEWDGRADLFALAAIVYEMLTGEHPYRPISERQGVSLARFLVDRIPSGIQPLRRRCPDLERPVAAVLERCLAVDPADRPASAAELAAALKRQFAPARRVRRWLAARRRYVFAALALFALLAGLAGYLAAIAPSFCEREYRDGKTAYHEGRFAEAEAHFDRAVLREPTEPRWRRARGWARLRESNWLQEDDARDKMDQAWNDLVHGRTAHLDGPLLEVKAYLEARQQNAQRAISIYNHLEKSGYRSLSLLNNRAFCSIQWGLGRNRPDLFEQAAADLENALALDPNCPSAYYIRALFALCQKKVDQRSLDDIESALRLGPANAGLYRDAALLYSQAAQPARALSYARQAIALGQFPGQFVVFKKLVPPSELAELLALKPGPMSGPSELRLISPADEVE